jgi:hypothetical protein
VSDKPLSLRAYAKRVGVSVEAVSKAVTSGRLSGSVVRDERGAPKIGDVELADREWAANTRPRVDYPPVAPPADTGAAPPPIRKPAAEPSARARQAAPGQAAPAGDVPDYNVSRAVREAHAARREKAMADKAELEVAEMRGDLVAVDVARADVLDIFMRLRAKLLALPSRTAQRLPSLAHQIVPVLEELVREALVELDEEDDDEETGDEEAE